MNTVARFREILRQVKVRFTVPAVTYTYTTIIATFVASKGIPNLVHLAYAFLTSFFVLTAIYVYNDAMDVEIDRINHVDRPIATGRLSWKDGVILALILFFLGILSASINMETLVLSATLFLLGLLYSTPPVRLRNRFLVKHMMPATGHFISSLIGGTIVGSVSIQVVYLGFLMFMTVFAGAPIFDLPDLTGDKADMARSVAVLYGPRAGLKFSITGFFLVIVVTGLSYPYVGFNILMPIMLTSICLVFIWLAYGLLGQWQNVDYCRKTVFKIVGLNFLYQLSFILGILKTG